MVSRIVFADNMPILRAMPEASVPLIYIDPPFNTGKTQRHTALKTVRSATGDRRGFQGARYETIALGSRAYPDIFDDYLAFLEPRLVEAYRVLAPHGTLYFHIDYREAHYCKVLLDTIFGRRCFLNEIIWAYDYGGAHETEAGPPKHDTILVYVKDPARYYLQRRRDRPRAVHGARARRAGESGARQGADRYLVAHHRADEQPGAHRLPDTEAARHPHADCRHLVQSRRPGARLLRGQRHDGRGLPRARPVIRARR